MSLRTEIEAVKINKTPEYISNSSVAMDQLNKVDSSYLDLFSAHTLGMECFINDLSVDERYGEGLNLIKVNSFCDTIPPEFNYSKVREIVWDNMDKYANAVSIATTIRNSVTTINAIIDSLQIKYKNFLNTYTPPPPAVEGGTETPPPDPLTVFWENSTDVGDFKTKVSELISFVNQSKELFVGLRKNIEEWIALGGEALSKIMLAQQVNNQSETEIGNKTIGDFLKNNADFFGEISPGIGGAIPIVDESKEFVKNNSEPDQVESETIGDDFDEYGPKASIEKTIRGNRPDINEIIKQKVLEQMNIKNRSNVFLNRITEIFNAI